METTLSIEKLEKVAFILKTIAHPLRLGMVDLLTTYDQLSVNEICEKLNAEQSLVSHHLINMKLKGILGSSREGKKIYYHLKMQEVVKVIACMEGCDTLLWQRSFYNINIPLPERRERVAEINTTQPIVAHCAGGYRLPIGASTIQKNLNDIVEVYDWGKDVEKFKK